MSNKESRESVIQFLKDTIIELAKDSGIEDIPEITETTCLGDLNPDSIIFVKLACRIEQKYEIFYEELEMVKKYFQSIEIIADRIMDVFSRKETLFCNKPIVS